MPGFEVNSRELNSGLHAVQQAPHPVSCRPSPRSLSLAVFSICHLRDPLKVAAWSTHSSLPPVSGMQQRVLLAFHVSQIKGIMGQPVESSVVFYFREKLKLFKTYGSRDMNEQCTIQNKNIYHCLWFAVQTLFRKRSSHLHKV